jgi:alpha-D-xyloside xylohydrolase
MTPACRCLDMQYMLGPALLVAPIFSVDGEVSHYLPRGEWRHLLIKRNHPRSRLG